MNTICALGSYWYTPNLDSICGPEPTTHLNLDNAHVIYDQACLRLEDTGWADGTVTLVGGTPPMSDCAGYVGETEADTGGVPIKVCQQDYPDTRMTFLAVLTGTDGGSSTVCITENAGA